MQLERGIDKDALRRQYNLPATSFDYLLENYCGVYTIFTGHIKNLENKNDDLKKSISNFIKENETLRALAVRTEAHKE